MLMEQSFLPKKFHSALLKDVKSDFSSTVEWATITDSDLNKEFQELLKTNLDVVVLGSTSFHDTRTKWSSKDCENVLLCIGKVRDKLPTGNDRGLAEKWELIFENKLGAVVREVQI